MHALEDVLSVEREPWIKQQIKFGPTNKVTESFHNDSLVINVQLYRYDVRRVLVDIGNSVNLLTLEVLNKLGLDKKKSC